MIELLHIIAMLCNLSGSGGYDSMSNRKTCQKFYMECMDRKTSYTTNGDWTNDKLIACVREWDNK